MNRPGLTDGFDADQIAALGDMGELEAQLDEYGVPEPDSAVLLARLEARIGNGAAPAWQSWLRLAETQVSMLHARFWLATALLLGLGIALVVAYGSTMMIVYALASPVLAVAGTAYLFRPETRTMHEFELFSDYSPLALLYVRLLLVLGYTTGVTLLLLLAASFYGTPVVFWRLLLIWIGPMVGLTGLALYSSQRWNAYAGTALPLGLWGALIALGWREFVERSAAPVESSEAFVLTMSMSNGLLLAAAASFGGGLLLIWRVHSAMQYGGAAE